VWQLTQEQQALAAEYFYVAQATAKRMERVWDPDRTLSASCLGLCCAAHKWIPGSGKRTFKNYAIWSCRMAIISDLRRDNRERRNTRKDGTRYPYLAMTNAASFDLERSYDPSEPILDESVESKQHTEVSHALHVLAPQEMVILELTLNGLKPYQIDKLMGLKRHISGAALSRGTEKLRKELSK
jgi:DNA-directed RNA polymerase specialized sigma24 family protein